MRMTSEVGGGLRMSPVGQCPTTVALDCEPNSCAPSFLSQPSDRPAYSRRGSLQHGDDLPPGQAATPAFMVRRHETLSKASTLVWLDTSFAKKSMLVDCDTVNRRNDNRILRKHRIYEGPTVDCSDPSHSLWWKDTHLSTIREITSSPLPRGLLRILARRCRRRSTRLPACPPGTAP